MMPKVSVCIPSYNHGDFIGKAIESVLNQTIKDFELIIVDDCSRDNTAEVIRNYRDPRIRFYKNRKNLGMVPNVNKAVKLAESEFIGILNSDDYYAPFMLERALNILEKNPRIGFTTSSYIVVNEKNEEIVRVKHYDKLVVFPPKEGFRRLIQGNLNPPSGVIFRKRCLEEVGLFDNEFQYCHDWNMWLRMSQKYHFAYIPEFLFYYRIHKKNASIAIYNSFLTALQEYHMLKKLEQEVRAELKGVVTKGIKRTGTKVVINSFVNLLLKSRNESMRNFVHILDIEKERISWIFVPLFVILTPMGKYSFKLLSLIGRHIFQFKHLLPFSDPKIIFYRYHLE